MNWIQFPILFFLLFVFFLFQTSQIFDWERLACDTPPIIRSDSDSSLDETLGFDSKKRDPGHSISVQLNSRLRNPLSVPSLFFQGTFPFRRPPPTWTSPISDGWSMTRLSYLEGKAYRCISQEGLRWRWTIGLLESQCWSLEWGVPF